MIFKSQSATLSVGEDARSWPHTACQYLLIIISTININHREKSNEDFETYTPGQPPPPINHTLQRILRS